MEQFDLVSVLFGIAIAYIANILGSVENLIFEKALRLREERKMLKERVLE